MVERVEKFSAELPLESLSHSEHLEQAEVRHLNSGSVKGAGSARSECSLGGKRECCGIEEETCRGIALQDARWHPRMDRRRNLGKKRGLSR